MKSRKRTVKLQTKFILIFLLIGVLVCIGNLIAIHILQNANNKELYNANAKVLSLFADSVQSELDRVAEDSQNMIGDDILQKELSRLKEATETDSFLTFQSENAVSKRLASFDFYSEHIRFVCLVSENGNVYGRFDIDHEAPPENLAEMVTEAKKANGKAQWLFFPELEGSLVMVRQIREKKNFSLDELGTLIIKVNLDKIVADANRPVVANGEKAQVAIYQNEAQIYSSNAMMGKLPVPEKRYEIVETSEGKFFVSSYLGMETGWVYVTAVEFNSIFRSLTSSLQISVYVLLCVILSSILLGSGITRRVVKQIERLTVLCDDFAKGKYVPTPDLQKTCFVRTDEIGRLYRHFDNMALENKRMIQEVYEKRQVVLQTQIANLRQQIGSHFIYNTLESIYCLAELNGDERISILTSSLGKMLRTSLKEQRNVVPLKEDVDIAKEYIKIQSIRLDGRLEIYIDIDESFYNIRIPHMTIQPLIENAISYAAEEMLEKCEIRLYCRKHEICVEIIVEDNGQGMDTDIINKIEQGIVIPKGLGIGLENINKRLKLLISPASEIIIERKNERTMVIVRLVPA